MTISGVSGTAECVLAEATVTGEATHVAAAHIKKKRDNFIMTMSSLVQTNDNSWEQNQNFHRHVVLRD